MSAARRGCLALAVLPLAAATAGEPAPPPRVPLEMLEFLAEEPAGAEGMEDALMSRELDRAMGSIEPRASRKPKEGDGDEG